ncbi:hypothetical protein LSH36_591g01042 [Paralvinella palmiformis]|uniref:Uncharacterized protein n=1 Tax=Paralvinella palmiformis TaxID=53620 RepID=A0AAD9MWR8_9ANNE|nr:hypothetical protein LSH36_591g01042 [Paralvinella palmiformis]
MRNKSKKLSMFLAPPDPYEISRLTDSLKRKNSSGHDGITSSLIKDIKHKICLPVTLLINKSISAGIVSDLLKTTQIKEN